MRLEEVEAGPPRAGLVRLKIRASAINFFDALMVAGQYQTKPELPFIPGSEVSGEVLSAPADSGFQTGDRVMAVLTNDSLTSGGYAEIADSPAASLIRMPAEMPFDEGAAFWVTYQTGWFGLFRRANLQAGETLLVHAGAGGVGSAAIQLAKAVGATVIATAGSDEKVDVCRRLGADHAINYTTQDFAEEVKRLTGGQGANVIYDPVGGDVYDRSTKCVAFEGRIVVVGFTSGRIPQPQLNHALVKNYSIVGLHWGLYVRRAPHLIPLATEKLMELYAAGRIKPYISARFAFDDAPAALASVAGRKSTGKVILQASP
jgi:NADPH:quinone reductase